METIQLRFPTLAKNILNNLEDQSLLKYQESSKDNYDFLKSEKFYWMRIIKKYNKYFETCNESWKKAILKTNAEFLKKLAMALFNFIKLESDDLIKTHFQEDALTPVLIAAYDGDVCFFEQIKDKTLDTIQTNAKISSLNLAAYKGNFALCNLLLNKLENKNPNGKYGATSLMYAACSGNLEVFKLFYNTLVCNGIAWFVG